MRLAWWRELPLPAPIFTQRCEGRADGIGGKGGGTGAGAAWGSGLVAGASAVGCGTG